MGPQKNVNFTKLGNKNASSGHVPCTIFSIYGSYMKDTCLQFGGIHSMDLKVIGVHFFCKFLAPLGGKTIHRMQRSFQGANMLWTCSVTTLSTVGLRLCMPQGGGKTFHACFLLAEN